MLLIILSIILGFITLLVGDYITDDFITININIIFFLIGFLSPSLYILEKMYKDFKTRIRNEKDDDNEAI